MRWIVNAWQWLRSLFRRSARQWKTVRVDDVPEKALVNVIYLVGEGKFLWFAVFLCPCGCAELIQLNLLADASPQWQVIQNGDGTITLAPSVWRTKGCGSHFFVRRGRIVWC